MEKRPMNLVKYALQDIYNPEYQDGSRLFFVTGFAKSGTTWLGKLMNSHPQLFCSIRESCFMIHAQASNRYKYLLEGPIDHAHKINSFAILRNGIISYLLFQCDKPEADLFGDKTPNLLVTLILEIFPQAKVLIIIRDPRDAIVSRVFQVSQERKIWEGLFTSSDKKTISDDFFHPFIGVIRNYYVQYLEFLEKFEKQIFVLRYEELSANPRPIISDCFEFLNVDSSPQIVRHCVDENTFEKLSGGRKPGEEDPNSFFRKGIAGDWQNYLSSNQLKIIEKEIGYILKEIGYE